MPDRKVKFLRALICDDIRQEFDGRFNLLGVISGEIEFSARSEGESEDPDQRIGIYIEFEITETTSIQCRIIHRDEGMILGEMNVELEKDPDSETIYGSIPISPKVFEFPKSGNYDFQVREVNFDWETLNTIRINITPYSE